jgi:hypothetical protein
LPEDPDGTQILAVYDSKRENLFSSEYSYIVNVFVSSTREDLAEDCRPQAIAAIQESDGVAVTMESWDTDYDDPVDVCQRKIAHESTHFLGIFAYRRGWIPPSLAENGKSITEFEFDLAVRLKEKGRLQVFLPQPGTSFADTLKQRAVQTEVEAEAQKAFLRRVSQKTPILFEDLPAFTRKVTRTICRWGQSLRQAARAVPTVTAEATSAQNRKSTSQLGRDPHFRQFQDLIKDRSLPEVKCFLVHGPIGYGHRELVQRLCEELELSSNPQPKYSLVDLGVIARPNDLATLLMVAGDGIRKYWTPSSPADFADELKVSLNASDVILDIANVQDFHDQLPGLLNEFWKPVVAALETPVLHRFTVFLRAERDIAADWEPLLYGLTNPAATFDPAKPVKLPRLTAFTVNEVEDWLRGLLPLAEARQRAQKIIADTDGVPNFVYHKLRA